MPTVTINDLPYKLPTDTASQLQKLAQITSIPSNLLIGAGEKEVEAICYMILYRHLDQHLRMKAMASIRSVKKRASMGELIKHAVDTTFVNPQWGVWSLTNSELNADLELHTHLTSIAGTLCSGLMIPDTKLGGKVSTTNEVFNDKTTTTYIFF